MTQTYRIASIGGPTLWEEGSPKGDYFATLQGFDGEVLIFHDSSSNYDAPKVGDELFGTVEKDKRGNLRFKRASRNRSTQSSTGGGGGSRQSEGPGLSWRSAPYERGAEHPRNEARAIHTSALSAAPAYYELLRTEGVLDQAKDKPSMLDTLAGIVLWLEGGYGPVLDAVVAPGAGAAQEPAQGRLNGGPQEEIPADRTDLAPAAATTADEDLPF